MASPKITTLQPKHQNYRPENDRSNSSGGISSRQPLSSPSSFISSSHSTKNPPISQKELDSLDKKVSEYEKITKTKNIEEFNDQLKNLEKYIIQFSLTNAELIKMYSAYPYGLTLVSGGMAPIYQKIVYTEIKNCAKLVNLRSEKILSFAALFIAFRGRPDTRDFDRLLSNADSLHHQPEHQSSNYCIDTNRQSHVNNHSLERIVLSTEISPSKDQILNQIDENVRAKHNIIVVNDTEAQRLLMLLKQYIVSLHLTTAELTAIYHMRPYHFANLQSPLDKNTQGMMYNKICEILTNPERDQADQITIINFAVLFMLFRTGSDHVRPFEIMIQNADQYTQQQEMSTRNTSIQQQPSVMRESSSVSRTPTTRAHGFLNSLFSTANSGAFNPKDATKFISTNMNDAYKDVPFSVLIQAITEDVALLGLTREELLSLYSLAFNRQDRILSFCNLLKQYVDEKNPQDIKLGNNPESIISRFAICFLRVNFYAAQDIRGPFYTSLIENQINAKAWKQRRVDEANLRSSKLRIKSSEQTILSFPGNISIHDRHTMYKNASKVNSSSATIKQIDEQLELLKKILSILHGSGIKPLYEQLVDDREILTSVANIRDDGDLATADNQAFLQSVEQNAILNVTHAQTLLNLINTHINRISEDKGMIAWYKENQTEFSKTATDAQRAIIKRINQKLAQIDSLTGHASSNEALSFVSFFKSNNKEEELSKLTAQVTALLYEHYDLDYSLYQKTQFIVNIAQNILCGTGDIESIDSIIRDLKQLLPTTFQEHGENYTNTNANNTNLNDDWQQLSATIQNQQPPALPNKPFAVPVPPLPTNLPSLRDINRSRLPQNEEIVTNQIHQPKNQSIKERSKRRAITQEEIISLSDDNSTIALHNSTSEHNLELDQAASTNLINAQHVSSASVVEPYYTTTTTPATTTTTTTSTESPSNNTVELQSLRPRAATAAEPTTTANTADTFLQTLTTQVETLERVVVVRSGTVLEIQKKDYNEAVLDTISVLSRIPQCNNEQLDKIKAMIARARLANKLALANKLMVSESSNEFETKINKADGLIQSRLNALKNQTPTSSAISTQRNAQQRLAEAGNNHAFLSSRFNMNQLFASPKRSAAKANQPNQSSAGLNNTAATTQETITDNNTVSSRPRANTIDNASNTTSISPKRPN